MCVVGKTGRIKVGSEWGQSSIEEGVYLSVPDSNRILLESVDNNVGAFSSILSKKLISIQK